MIALCVRARAALYIGLFSSFAACSSATCPGGRVGGTGACVAGAKPTATQRNATARAEAGEAMPTQDAAMIDEIPVDAAEPIMAADAAERDQPGDLDGG